MKLHVLHQEGAWFGKMPFAAILKTAEARFWPSTRERGKLLAKAGVA